MPRKLMSIVFRCDVKTALDIMCHVYFLLYIGLFTGYYGLSRHVFGILLFGGLIPALFASLWLGLKYTRMLADMLERHLSESQMRMIRGPWSFIIIVSIVLLLVDAIKHWK